MWRVWGDVAAHMGQAVQVDEGVYHPGACYEKSVALLAAAGMVREQAITLWHWTRYEIAQGNQPQGEELRRTAQALFQQLNLPLWVAWLDSGQV